MQVIVILGTLDTKGEEVAFLAQAVRSHGLEPLVVDTGVLGKPALPAHVTREEVAAAGGSSLEALVAANDKAHALVVMAEGATQITRRLLQEGRLGGVLSVGGSRGTELSTRVMQALPVGIPKLMVSTMAAGHTPFGPYTGTRDVTLMPSVADILGVNAVTRPILTNAAAGIVGMARVGSAVVPSSRRALAATMLGASTALVEQIRRLVEAGGSELIAFHAVGSGGRAMEDLIRAGLFAGVFDVTTAEIAGLVAGGPFSAGPERMRAAGRAALPQVVAPGGLDFIIEGPADTLPTRYHGRKIMQHTSTITLVRTSPDEMCEAARLIAGRLAESAGPATAILPLRGFSWFSMAGQPLHDEDADRAFIDTFKACVPASVQVVEMDTHLNDAPVAREAVRLMEGLIQRE